VQKIRIKKKKKKKGGFSVKQKGKNITFLKYSQIKQKHLRRDTESENKKGGFSVKQKERKLYLS
jgi:hypothetical protein